MKKLLTTLLVSANERCSRGSQRAQNKQSGKGNMNSNNNRPNRGGNRNKNKFYWSLRLITGRLFFYIILVSLEAINDFINYTFVI